MPARTRTPSAGAGRKTEKRAEFSREQRASLIGAIEARFGLSLLEGVKVSVANSARKLLDKEQIELAELLHRLEGGAETDPFVNRMREAASIGETYFFRVPAQLSALQSRVVETISPRKSAAFRRQLRVWSAACSTGEEVYTLAILFRLALPDFEIAVLGTDMNEASLEVARRGYYKGRAFREVTAKSLSGMLVEDGAGWSVSPEIRKLVTFQRLNLVTDLFPNQERQIANFDVVVCRNVLIYLAPARIPTVMAKLAASCAPTSILVLTPAEYAAARHATNFVDTSQGILVRRPGTVAPARPSAPVAAPAPSSPSFAAPSPSAPPPQRLPETRPEAAPSLVESFAAALESARQEADRGAFDRAREFIAQARALRPDAAEPHCLLGVTFHAMGDWEGAAREFQKAVFLDRTLVAAELGLGHALIAGRQIDEAKRHFARVLALLQHLPVETMVPATGITVAVARRIATNGLEEFE